MEKPKGSHKEEYSVTITKNAIIHINEITTYIAYVNQQAQVYR
jgi:hypothetical protein